MKQRQVAFHKKDMEQFKSLRNKVNRERKNLQKKHFTKRLESVTSGSKGWWNDIKQITNQKQANNAMLGLANHHFNGNIQDLTNAINKSFWEVSANLEPLEENQPQPQEIPAKYIISVDDVIKKLSKIKVHKSKGPDNIPNWILHDLADVIGPPICAIFNSSIRESTLPEIWKRANLTPLPKVKAPKDIKKDLRPISLTPVLSKCLESFVCDWLWEIIEPEIKIHSLGA